LECSLLYSVGLTAEPVEFRIPELPRGENEAVQSRVNRLRSVCGCTAGAAASLSALFLYVIILSTSPLGDGLGAAAKWLVGAAIVILVGAITKAIAIVWARHRLNRMIGSLADRIGAGQL
jgi:peptidoglycan/LPS O-acetylase OafA/YrhL